MTKRTIWKDFRSTVFNFFFTGFTKFLIKLASASVQKCPFGTVSQQKGGVCNNLILNAYFKRLKLITLVMRTQRGAVLGAQSSSDIPQHVETCRFWPQPADARYIAQLNFGWGFDRKSLGSGVHSITRSNCKGCCDFGLQALDGKETCARTRSRNG